MFLPFYRYNGVDVPLTSISLLVGLLYIIVGMLGLILLKECPVLSWIFGIAGLVLLAITLPSMASVPGHLSVGPGFLLVGSGLLLAGSFHQFGAMIVHRNKEE